MPPDQTPSPPTSPSPRLLTVLRQILRPLVRLMLDHGIPYRPAADLLNQVYVEVATTALEGEGKKATDSRLSVMTGIHRKALRQHREHGERDSSVPKSIALGSQLVQLWTSDPRYCDAEGAPRPLPRRSGDGNDESFDGLVRSVSSDVHPRSVLDEWLRLGVVRVEAGGHTVHLVTSAFVPSQGFEEKLFYLGRNVRDHLETALHNLEGFGPASLERSVHYDGLDPEDVSRLSRFAEEAGMRLLEEVNRRAREMREEARRSRSQEAVAGGEAAFETDAPPRQPRVAGPPDDQQQKSERMNFGLYFFHGPSRPGPDVAAREGPLDGPLEIADQGEGDGD